MVLTGHESSVNSAQFSPDGTAVVTASNMGPRFPGLCTVRTLKLEDLQLSMCTCAAGHDIAHSGKRVFAVQCFRVLGYQ